MVSLCITRRSFGQYMRRRSVSILMIRKDSTTTTLSVGVCPGVLDVCTVIFCCIRTLMSRIPPRRATGVLVILSGASVFPVEIDLCSARWNLTGILFALRPTVTAH